MTYDVLGSGVANVRWVCGMEPVSQVDVTVDGSSSYVDNALGGGLARPHDGWRRVAEV